MHRKFRGGLVFAERDELVPADETISICEPAKNEAYFQQLNGSSDQIL